MYLWELIIVFLFVGTYAGDASLDVHLLQGKLGITGAATALTDKRGQIHQRNAYAITCVHIYILQFHVLYPFENALAHWQKIFFW